MLALFTEAGTLIAQGGFRTSAFCVVLILTVAVLSFIAGKLSMQRRLSSARKDALKRSRAVLGGQAAEQVAPFLPGFPCNSADARFIGKPIDFIAFPGAADGAPIEEVLLIEVKTGSSQLSSREREIQRAVESGRVRYVVYRADEH